MFRRYTKEQIKTRLPDTYKFPEKFDHISSETAQIIGVEDTQAEATHRFEKDIERIRERAKKNAGELYDEEFALYSQEDEEGKVFLK